MADEQTVSPVPVPPRSPVPPRADRAALKARARTLMHTHYWMIVALCLLLAFLGIEYASSLWATGFENPSMTTERIQTIAGQVATGQEPQARAEVEQAKRDIEAADAAGGNPMLGHSRGVLATVVDSFSSGGIVLSVMDAIRSISRSENMALVIFVALSLAVYFFLWLFVTETAMVSARRMLLEARVYAKVPAVRFLVPLRSGHWARIAWVMFVRTVLLYAWALTIVGAVVKYYSYFLVPYILAENPSLKAREAITLSRTMMRGHKWECFVHQLTFLGWNLLNVVTLGLVGVFWSNGYQAAFFTEYYVALRREAHDRSLPGAARLCDEALYAAPSRDELMAVYPDAAADVARVSADGEMVRRPDGLTGWLAEWFGVTPRRSARVIAWERHEAQMDAVAEERDVLEGLAYPDRMLPTDGFGHGDPWGGSTRLGRAWLRLRGHLAVKPRTPRPVTVPSGRGATRSYTLLNLMAMFLIFCLIGWVWEVVLAFITEGTFVKRGTLHGPWLPIYGTGGVLILVALKRLRERPVVEFLATMGLCGAIEYFSSWALEMMHGERWWDYTGYFLNLNGRICAEGLLAFGLGGMAIVYVAAPALDDLLTRLDRRALRAVTLVLLSVFAVDWCYSQFHPNTGPGVTDYKPPH